MSMKSLTVKMAQVLDVNKLPWTLSILLSVHQKIPSVSRSTVAMVKMNAFKLGKKLSSLISWMNWMAKERSKKLLKTSSYVNGQTSNSSMKRQRLVS